MNIFASLQAGDSATWNDAPFTDSQGAQYSAPGWSLSYVITGAQTGAALTLNAAVLGSGWTTSITAAQSGALVPGTYSWSAYATNGSQRVTAGQGTLLVTKNIQGLAGPYDARSTAQQIVDAIDAYMLGQATSNQLDVIEYQLNLRHMKKDKKSLLDIRNYYQIQVRNEQTAARIANGLGNPRRVMVRFK